LSALQSRDEQELLGVRPTQAMARLRAVDSHARAFWLYDLDAFEKRAKRLIEAFAPLGSHLAYALKANGLPAIVRAAQAAGLAADAGSLGELELARTCGFDAPHRTLSGNGHTLEEATWVAQHGVNIVSADHVGELDMLQRAVALAQAPPQRVALRVNPRIEIPGHPHVATGGYGAKFGIGADEALAVWASRARWPHLRLDALHLHVGSQMLDTEPLERATLWAMELAREAESRGSAISHVNLGGGFGVDYTGASEFPLEQHAHTIRVLTLQQALRWHFEPGRWLVAPIGALIAEVLWVKQRPGDPKRFVVLAVGMNDLIRPALYGSKHRIVPVKPRAGELTPATVVGPVCESGDTFDREALLPPLEPGDLVAILDVGAYGSAMSSNYNGRGRLAELVVHGGAMRLARRAETPADLLARQADEALGE
jgi:diaminopimelate decarboxylase